MEGLPGVLETRRHFHSALLRDDIRKILGHDVNAAFSPATRDYLGALYEGLASANSITRVAYMVSFESHAERMIMGLWNRIAETFPVQKDDLAYFHAHVGGDDPAEAYHVATTAGMIAKIVPVERFPLSSASSPTPTTARALVRGDQGSVGRFAITGPPGLVVCQPRRWHT